MGGQKRGPAEGGCDTGAGAQLQETSGDVTRMHLSPVVSWIDVYARATCQPREVVVPLTLELMGTVAKQLVPSCVTVQRCGGCCPDDGLECVPTGQHQVRMQVAWAWLGWALVLGADGWQPEPWQVGKRLSLLPMECPVFSSSLFVSPCSPEHRSSWSGTRAASWGKCPWKSTASVNAGASQAHSERAETRLGVWAWAWWYPATGTRFLSGDGHAWGLGKRVGRLAFLILLLLVSVGLSFRPKKREGAVKPDR